MTPDELIRELGKLPKNCDIRYLDISTRDDCQPGNTLDWEALDRTAAVGIEYPEGEQPYQSAMPHTVFTAWASAALWSLSSVRVTDEERQAYEKLKHAGRFYIPATVRSQKPGQ